ncbi:hypothetical protein BU15DRAFT_67759 [Melanogaster broomeanus]|nr:hypothetical protein BU15DRAFT_67759 [Melanogaster broomeanus]
MAFVKGLQQLRYGSNHALDVLGHSKHRQCPAQARHHLHLRLSQAGLIHSSSPRCSSGPNDPPPTYIRNPRRRVGRSIATALFGLIIVAALFVSGRLLLCNRRYGEDVESRGRNQGPVMVQRRGMGFGEVEDLVPPPPVYTSTGKPPSYSSKEDLSAGRGGQALEEDEPRAAPVARPTEQ